LIDYRLWWDQSTDIYVVLVESTTAVEYTTDFVLTPGALYKFKLEAYNSVGYSQYSEILEI
jgi:hypothetical protein